MSRLNEYLETVKIDFNKVDAIIKEIADLELKRDKAQQKKNSKDELKYEKLIEIKYDLLSKEPFNMKSKAVTSAVNRILNIDDWWLKD